MTADLKKQFDEIFLRLQEFGLLLLSDSHLPNVSRLVAGEKVSGSWWSHKMAHRIFAVCEMLEDHPDVLIVKLVSSKVTFVHRELWERVYSIGVAREDWQLKQLPSDAKRLLETLDAQGSLQTNKLGKEFGPKPSETARTLESRLLLHSNQIHTESGAHAKVIETWDTWADGAGFRAKTRSPAAARRFLERQLNELHATFGGSSELPWPTDV